MRYDRFGGRTSVRVDVVGLYEPECVVVVARASMTDLGSGNWQDRRLTRGRA